MIKKLVLVAFVCAMGMAQALTLAEARGLIGKCVNDPKTMTATMKQLSAADQTAFLAEVNAAIEDMPGSNEAKATVFLDANKAALSGAAKGNVAALIAEVYATVPVEVLPIISESFAKDLLNRSSDSTKSYSDEQFTKIAQTVMAKVAERVASSEDGDKRASIAAATMIKSAGDATPEMSDAIIKTLPESAREDAAKNVPAMVAGNYDGVVEESMPIEVVLRLSPTMLLDTVLSDVDEGIFHESGSYNTHDSSHLYDAENTIQPTLEPNGYQGQTID